MRRTFQEGADGNGPTAKQRRTTANPLNTDAENRMEGHVVAAATAPASTEEGKRRLLAAAGYAVAGVMVGASSHTGGGLRECATGFHSLLLV